MDPEITFAEFKLAVSEGRLEDAAEHAENLLNWLNSGRGLRCPEAGACRVRQQQPRSARSALELTLTLASLPDRLA